MELLRVNNLKKVFPKQNKVAVDGVTFSISKGEIFGLVGESGCGKSTLAKCILRLTDIQAGGVFYKGQDLLKISKNKMKALRKEMQIIFQDPYMSLDPRMKVGSVLEEVYIIHENLSRPQRQKQVLDLLDMVGLGGTYLNRLPSELSGGERQRIGIARALASNPEFIVCDEPVSSLDISIQAQILNLLMDIKKKKNLTYLFISHDLGVVSSICDRVAVMQSGKLVEIGLCEDVFNDPKEEYTKKLLSSSKEICLSPISH